MEVAPQSSEAPVTKAAEDSGNDANGDKVRHSFSCYFNSSLSIWVEIDAYSNNGYKFVFAFM